MKVKILSCSLSVTDLVSHIYCSFGKPPVCIGYNGMKVTDISAVL